VHDFEAKIIFKGFVTLAYSCTRFKGIILIFILSICSPCSFFHSPRPFPVAVLKHDHFIWWLQCTFFTYSSQSVSMDEMKVSRFVKVHCQGSTSCLPLIYSINFGVQFDLSSCTRTCTFTYKRCIESEGLVIILPAFTFPLRAIHKMWADLNTV